VAERICEVAMTYFMSDDFVYLATILAGKLVSSFGIELRRESEDAHASSGTGFIVLLKDRVNRFRF
jgi:hypothetical protein